MKWLVVIILLAVFLHTSDCHYENVCIPVPRGAKGDKGDRGVKGVRGIPGQCTCDLSHIERAIEKLNQIAKTSHREQFCFAGLKDGRVKDEDMSSSSFWSSEYKAHYGRLDNTGDQRGVWHPARGHNKAGEWLQVDFKTPTRIVGVITQGRPNLDQWTTSYKIAYGNSTNSLQTIKSSTGADMIFQGNRDRNTHVTNIFPEPVTARYFRIVVVTFQSWPVLRIEFLVS